MMGDSGTVGRSPRERWIELALAAGVVIFGFVVVWQTTKIGVPRAYSQIGPRVLPYIVGSGLVFVGVWLAVEALTGRGVRPGADAEDADLNKPTDWRTVVLLALALLVYLLLIERAGFIIASALLYAGAAYAMHSRRVVLDLAVGIIIATALYIGFTRGLDLRLPAGVLDDVI